MSFTNTVVAEARKAATLPATFAGAAVALFGSAAITLLNAFSVRAALDAGRPELRAFTSPFEVAFAATPLGTVAAVVLGVVIVGSEYTANGSETGGGRQITATLTATPRRVGVLAAKAFTVVLLVVVIAAVTIPVCVGVSWMVLGAGAPETVAFGEAVARSLGATLYWTLMGLIAFSITVLTRSGVIPLIVLIVNGSLVSFSYLLSRLTPIAHWLPDLAGRRLFVGVETADGGLGATAGALVMTAWTVVLLTVAGVVFTKRDA